MSVGTQTPPERLWGTAAPEVIRRRLREAMGRAHYDRMRSGMTDLHLPPWEELLPGTREIHRGRHDYLLSNLMYLIATNQDPS